MPWTHRIIADRELIIVTGTGLLTDDDVVGGVRALVGDPDFRPTFRVFTDFGGLTDVRVTSDTVRRVAERRQLAPTVQIFRTREDAVRWLDGSLPPEKRME